MRFQITIMTFLLMTGGLYAQVSNVRVVQRTDGNFVVDIWYDLGFEGDSYTKTAEIIIEASHDNGASWNLSCSSLTGDVGEGITAGTDKHIEWDFYADHPNTSGNQYKVRLLFFYNSTMTGNDGKVYKTVKIGNQWWMAENLRETKYRNGISSIPVVASSSTWSTLETGARCVYNNNENYTNSYGYLYNWYVVATGNLAPSGWHVPTYYDFSDLYDFLGGSKGGKMKETGYAHWDYPNTAATNESGFTAIAAGRRNDDGNFNDIWEDAWIWLAQQDVNGINGGSLTMSYNTDTMYNYLINKKHGCTIRLIKD